MLRDVLLTTAGGVPGTFVEIGANDGLFSTNTLSLEKCHKWRGLLIEANPSTFKQLLRSGRRQASMVNSAVCKPTPSASSASEQGFVEMTVDGGAVAGMVSEFSKRHKAKWFQSALKTVRVPCKPMPALMSDAGLPLPSTFLSLDVEGGEEFVLATFDASIFALIVIEWTSEASKLERIHRRLLEQRMVRVQTPMGAFAGHGSDRLYARDDVLPKLREANLLLAASVDRNPATRPHHHHQHAQSTSS